MADEEEQKALAEAAKDPKAAAAAAKAKLANMPASACSSRGGVNASKFTPDCVSINTNNMSSVSEVLSFWDYEG